MEGCFFDDSNDVKDSSDLQYSSARLDDTTQRIWGGNGVTEKETS